MLKFQTIKKFSLQPVRPSNAKISFFVAVFVNHLFSGKNLYSCILKRIPIISHVNKAITSLFKFRLKPKISILKLIFYKSSLAKITEHDRSMFIRFRCKQILKWTPNNLLNLSQFSSSFNVCLKILYIHCYIMIFYSKLVKTIGVIV